MPRQIRRGLNAGQADAYPTARFVDLRINIGCFTARLEPLAASFRESLPAPIPHDSRLSCYSNFTAPGAL